MQSPRLRLRRLGTVPGLCACSVPWAGDSCPATSVMLLSIGGLGWSCSPWPGLCCRWAVFPVAWAGQPCPAFLLLLLLPGGWCHSGLQGQLAPPKAWHEVTRSARSELEPVSWPRPRGVVLPAVCNIRRVVVLLSQLSLLSGFKIFRALLNTVALTSVYPLPLDR